MNAAVNTKVVSPESSSPRVALGLIFSEDIWSYLRNIAQYSYSLKLELGTWIDAWDSLV